MSCQRPLAVNAVLYFRPKGVLCLGMHVMLSLGENGAFRLPVSARFPFLIIGISLTLPPPPRGSLESGDKGRAAWLLQNNEHPHPHPGCLANREAAESPVITYCTVYMMSCQLMVCQVPGFHYGWGGAAVRRSYSFFTAKKSDSAPELFEGRFYLLEASILLQVLVLAAQP